MPRSPYAPIALFTYNRPWHTAQTLEYLKRNTLAPETDLIVFSDGPKPGSGGENDQRIAEVRKIIQNISGFRSVDVRLGDRNHGLAGSIIAGVSEVVGIYGKVIVLEDDMVTSPAFLSFLNWGIDTYSGCDEVVSVHAYVHPTEEPLPDTFFRYGAECWGWATWQRGWEHFNPDGQALLDALSAKGLEHEFDLWGAYPYTRMLRDQIEGRNDSWAIRWQASAFLDRKLTLYPGISYLKNIGLDGSGTHFGTEDRCNIDIEDLNTATSFPEIDARPNEAAARIIARSMCRTQQVGLVDRIRSRVRTWLGQ